MSDKTASASSGFNILLLLIRYWKTLLIIGIVSAIVSFTLSTPFFIKPKYKSSVIMFSTSSNAVSQLILAEGNYNEFLDITQFGDDAHIEQMIQILNSREIKDHIIEKFNLIEHYEIDTAKKYWKAKLYKYVKNNVQFSRTDNLAIEITVEDTDPFLAAQIANEIADYYDILKRQIVQQRSIEAFNILQEEMKLTDQHIMELTDSLSRIMSHGVYDYESQSERLTQQYAIELVKGNTAGVKRIKDELMILEQYGPLYVSVRDRLFYLKEAQKLFQEKYQNARVDASYTLPQKFVVEKAVPADKKSYPKKLMISFVTTLCVLLFTVFLLIFKEKIKYGFHEISQELKHKK
ncbi:MAG: Wzz/FepE/Etk N-terminal domain-containing protein [Bacteroidales bacterium]|nr:Wzz/FepE/Etk N-terminal domain-containing protein [Bacteroidales bacterium]